MIVFLGDREIIYNFVKYETILDFFCGNDLRMMTIEPLFIDNNIDETCLNP